jgi:rhodanese-related sulfurtransferase
MHPQLVTSARVQGVLSHATVVRAPDLVEHLKNQGARPDDPIVLMCEDGRLSNAAAVDAEAAGFGQVYVVEGGLDGLLREATLS